MKRFKLLLALILSGAWLYFLNGGIPGVPVLGEFLNPQLGFWQQAEAVTKNYEGHSDSLSTPFGNAFVEFDQHRIPHISAENELALYYAQGFITAKDRLWQMELQTHFAAGRVSEIVGEKAINLDRYNRKIGMWAAAQEMESSIENDTIIKPILEAYAAGVNELIASLTPAQYPLEYKLLNYAPEPWNITKSLVLIKYMANDLTGYDSDPQFTAYRNALGDSTFNWLFPNQFTEDTVAIIPYTMHDVDIAEKTNAHSSIEQLTFAQTSRQFFPDPDNGSNNWVIGPQKSASGNPILCNDPHLGLNLPSLWYEVQLNSPKNNTYGVSLPGLPLIVIGFNEHYAWGLTNAGRDVRDWYSVEFVDENKTLYRTSEGNLPVQTKIETFKTSEGNTYNDTVLITHWGPIVYDNTLNTDSSRMHLAMEWEALQLGQELHAVYTINTGRSKQDFQNALDQFRCPGQNFIFADNSGNIYLEQAGKFKDRQGNHGKFIVNGASNAIKEEYIPQNHSPHYENPETGFLSTANQHPTLETYPYGWHGDFEHYRNRRIHDVLSKGENLTMEDMRLLQDDDFYLLAYELRHLDKYLPNTTLSGAFANWDFYGDEDSKEATVFFEFWQELERLTWDELSALTNEVEYPEQLKLASMLSPQNLPTEENNPFFDIQETEQVETATDIIQMAWKNVSAKYASLDEVPRWGDKKNTTITHLARVLTPFNREVQVGGGVGMVNATKVGHGASWRMIVEVTPDGPIANGVYPGGQSGNPGSPFYDNFLSTWEAGQQKEIQYYPSKF